MEQAEFHRCLAELGNEYLRMGAEHCHNLTDKTQMSAFLSLGVRAISVAHCFHGILEAYFLDTYDAARRAFLETCYLQSEFRLKQSEQKALRWIAGEGGAWKPDFKLIESAILEPGPPIFGREYGDFSEMAHPTFVASQNSGAVLTHFLRCSENEEQLSKERQRLIDDIPALLFRMTWITFVTDEPFIEIPLERAKLPASIEFHKRYNTGIQAARNTATQAVPEG